MKIKLFSVFFLIFFLISQVTFSSIINFEENEEISNSILNSFIALVEGKMNSNLEIQRILSRTAELKSGKWMLAKELISTFQYHEDYSLIWYSLPDGNYYRSDVGLTDQNLFDRKYFPSLLNKNEVFGDIVTGKTSGKKSIIIAVPVINNSEVVSIIGCSIYCEEFTKALIEKVKLPDKAFFLIMDNDGNFILNSSEDLLIDNPFNEGTTSFKEAMKNVLNTKNGYEEFEYNNKLHKIIYEKSSLTNWIYIIGQTY
ncbi:MAG: hypothetical protein PWQ77_87 [Kosmotogales bacterium]|nr:hypothetical protein [Kosmotogales bacterium]